ncbi:hypothetical protein G195_002068 [Phytophthora kernoviae 00238/432]|uniref:ABC transporter domain-containing protein n=1 Tax=Phytophthora kernoviae 00238/432 TaxID=1284355 RepID=A0A8J4SW65_9STRA|nr:hypothetical protein G195_002068 [Phytophthora kernoviae 00238/432]
MITKGNAQAAGVTNLRCKFPGEKALVFQGLSLSVRQGEKVLLLGPSGSGKSTLMQILSGLIPRSVEIPMKCDDIQVPEQPGIVFQDPDTQFCMSYTDEEIAFVLENRNIPREQMPALIHQYLEQVGLHFEHNRTLIQSMSQGMKQRLAISSILAMEPDVLFLDEPTALLDDEGTSQVWDTVKQIAQDKTLIIVEHKINEIVEWVDRIIVLSPEGHYVVEGQSAGKTEQLADHIAFVFQNPEFQFVTNTVRDEVGFSLLGGKLTAEERDVRTNHMLEQFGLEELSERHPYQLSMGQKRRLSVASALVREQRILLLDEPTFGQDARNTFAMLSQLERLRREGTAIVMVTHDREIVKRYCNRIWTVDEGRSPMAQVIAVRFSVHSGIYINFHR